MAGAPVTLTPTLVNPPGVRLTITVGKAPISVALTTADARRLASELVDAVRLVEYHTRKGAGRGGVMIAALDARTSPERRRS